MLISNLDAFPFPRALFGSGGHLDGERLAAVRRHQNRHAPPTNPWLIKLASPGGRSTVARGNPRCERSRYDANESTR